MTSKLDQIDTRILKELQKDATLSQRELADRVGLSQNACWRRLKALNEDGVLIGLNRPYRARKAGAEPCGLCHAAHPAPFGRMVAGVSQPRSDQSQKSWIFTGSAATMTIS